MQNESRHPEANDDARVVSVHVGKDHNFSKTPKAAIKLIENFGVEGDAHAGEHDQHLFHIRRYGIQPNLRQVHLIQTEFFDGVLEKGHAVKPGDLGENIATKDVDLLALPTGTRLVLGKDSVVELTGLRNPCHQIDDFQPGLLQHCKDATPEGVVRKAGVMGIVIRGGTVVPGDQITIQLPPEPHEPLEYRPPAGGDA